jgi:Domain of unknown function (DUF4260)
MMKAILKLEEAVMTIIGIYFLCIFSLGLPIWVWALLFFAPDISMLGYLINTKAGAIIYNLFHHRGIAVLVAIWGYFFHHDMLTSIGILLFAHASFDRVWGYGLKYPDSFKNTHLGSLEKTRQ